MYKYVVHILMYTVLFVQIVVGGKTISATNLVFSNLRESPIA
jgi:hypothetical protein